MFADNFDRKSAMDALSRDAPIPFLNSIILIRRGIRVGFTE